MARKEGQSEGSGGWVVDGCNFFIASVGPSCPENQQRRGGDHPVVQEPPGQVSAEASGGCKELQPSPSLVPGVAHSFQYVKADNC